MNSDDLDDLLRTGLPGAPSDFSARVMQQISGLPVSTHQLRPTPRWQTLAQWLALVTAAALGISQVLAFTFGLWAVTAAAAA